MNSAILFHHYDFPTHGSSNFIKGHSIHSNTRLHHFQFRNKHLKCFCIPPFRPSPDKQASKIAYLHILSNAHLDTSHYALNTTSLVLPYVLLNITIFKTDIILVNRQYLTLVPILLSHLQKYTTKLEDKQLILPPRTITTIV